MRYEVQHPTHRVVIGLADDLIHFMDAKCLERPLGANLVPIGLLTSLICSFLSGIVVILRW